VLKYKTQNLVWNWYLWNSYCENVLFSYQLCL